MLEKLRAEGKVRAFGVATRFPQTREILAARADYIATNALAGAQAAGIVNRANADK